ncbi:MAG: SUMF1/EgtB/PvdO family nonheme iron enzyme [Phycisphaerae bacterium]|nr:SUMF1/EgtB/PvdO family nonheme iron enzyme [Phycisphaerae bacterium]
MLGGGRVVPARCLTAILLLLLSTARLMGEVPIEMRLVPGGGEPNGPSYDFWMGRWEVTVGQFLAFLNDAEANADNERGSYMVIDGATGDVGLADGSAPDGLFNISDCDPVFTYAPHYDVSYDANRPVGSRYQCAGDDEDFPIVGVSWIGAVKFCNWLTLELGMDPNQRCYTEGASVSDWHPVTISAGEWALRDLSDGERQVLVAAYRGVRLPMDDIGLENGYLDGRASRFNEWYKAAGYDANAPGTERIGDHDEEIPAYHWQYGYGSDDQDLSRANFLIYDANLPGGVDPNSIRVPTPVGWYYQSNGNPWGIDDLSGNVYEWGQDYSNSIAGPIQHSTRGRSYQSGGPAAAFRQYREVTTGAEFVGFRVLQSGSYRLTASVSDVEAGQVVVEPNQAVHPPWWPVRLTAKATGGSPFLYWYGDVPVEDRTRNPLVLTMSQDREITAVFNEFSLALGVEGQGTVSPDSGDYPEGVPVTVIATPADGWVFDGWEGDVSDSERFNNPLTIVMDRAFSIRARFARAPFMLIAQVIGEGTVMPGSGPYSEGTAVQLLARASSGWAFQAWEGDVPAGSEGDNPLTVVMDGERVITARFVGASSLAPVSPACASVPAGVTFLLVLTALGTRFRRGSRRS